MHSCTFPSSHAGYVQVVLKYLIPLLRLRRKTVSSGIQIRVRFRPHVVTAGPKRLHFTARQERERIHALLDKYSSGRTLISETPSQRGATQLEAPPHVLEAEQEDAREADEGMWQH